MAESFRINRNAMAGVVLWLGWAAIFFLCFRVQLQLDQKARKALPPLQQKMASYQELISKQLHVEIELAELRQQLQKLKEQGLRHEAIPKTIQQLAQIAAATNVTLESIAPREGVLGSALKLPEGIGKRALEIHLRCTYQSLGEFLIQIDKIPTPFTLDKISIQSLEPQETEATISVHLLMGTYGFL